MSALERIAQQEAQQQSSSELYGFINSMSAEMEQMRSLVKQVVESQNRVTEGMQVLVTSQQSGTDLQQLAQQQQGMRQETQEISKTLVQMSATLTKSEAVHLPDGSRVSRADLDSHSMMTTLRNEMKGVLSGTEKLAAEVHKKSQIRVDQSKVADAIAKRIEVAFDEKIEQAAQRFEKSMKAQEARVEALGEAKTSDVVEQISAARRAVQRYENTVGKLRSALTWSGVGSVALALIPFAMTGLVLATLLGLGGEVLGLGPLFGWAWESFDAAQLWWHKSLIAVGTLAGAFGVLWIIKAMGGKLADKYRGW